MVVRSLIGAVVLLVVAATSAGAGAADFDHCSLGHKYSVSSVNRYVVDVNAGYTSYTEFRGAELFVPAQPGLTQEWLQRVLSYEIAAGDCNFGVRDANVSVLSAGSGFQVRIAGADERAARQIWSHAQQL